MPKSAKKRKEKAADFNKVKLKLGKGKATPTNAIDTSFKARSIALPTQSITVTKDENAPTTKRQLTFEDLIVHLKHYSAGTRKDALTGLRELLESNWGILDARLTPLLNACARLIGDEDASVRKVLISFFSWLLPRIDQELLIPHSPLLLLFTTSAQTHIFPQIRIDAIRLLDVLLECIPHAVVAGWSEENTGHGSRVLEGYLGVLSAGTKFGETDGPMRATSIASVVLTPASKLIVLKSLSIFLENALAASQNKTPFPSQISEPWYLQASFTTPSAYNTFVGLLQTSLPHQRQCWHAEIDPGHDEFVGGVHTTDLHGQWDLQQLSDTAALVETLASDSTTQSHNPTFVAHLARTLHSTLISTFLDCAPTVFPPSSSPPDTELQLISTVAQILGVLYNGILQPSCSLGSKKNEVAIEDLESILGHMTPYFPFTPQGGHDIKAEQAFQDLNLIFCRLISLLILANGSESETTPGHRRGPHMHAGRKPKDALPMQTRKVNEYVTRLLGSGSGGQLARSLTPGAYTALLPTIWTLLNDAVITRADTPTEVLRVILQHAIKTSSRSSLKRYTIQFISRIALLETEQEYQGNFHFGRNPAEGELFEEWAGLLPKVLWELGSSDIDTSEMILRFMLRTMQRKSRLLQSKKTLVALQARLVPYFSIDHAIRGHVPGPFCNLPEQSVAQQLALDVAATLLSQGQSSIDQNRKLLLAIDTATKDNPNCSRYWLHLDQAFMLQMDSALSCPHSSIL
ncbi:hypothetical protein BD779DRAFT_1666462 [Infundibulicybe gibba]|nr:hypothetical protein BD779DRAFT_1666462 [Infundibulicybe gibba]